MPSRYSEVAVNATYLSWECSFISDSHISLVHVVVHFQTAYTVSFVPYYRLFIAISGDV